MEDYFKNTLFAFILIGLFGMLLLSVIVQTASNYDKDTSEVTGGALSLSEFNESVTGVEQRAKSLKETFESGSIWSAIAGVVVEGIFGIAKDMIDMILAPFNLIVNIMIDIFNIPSWVTSIVLGLLILGTIFGVWRLLKVGD